MPPLQSHPLKHVLPHPSMMHEGLLPRNLLRVQATPPQIRVVPWSPLTWLGVAAVSGLRSILPRTTKFQVAVVLLHEAEKSRVGAEPGVLQAPSATILEAPRHYSRTGPAKRRLDTHGNTMLRNFRRVSPHGRIPHRRRCNRIAACWDAFGYGAA